MSHPEDLMVSPSEVSSQTYVSFDCCRVCGGKRMVPVLDLEQQCIGNAFHHADDPASETAPLELVRCNECSLVQLAHSVDTSLMYSTYWYKSGVNRTMREHLSGLAQQAQRLVTLDAGDAVIDIGCNDGTSLSCYPESARRIGVDPSNIVPTVCDHFVNDYFSWQAVEGALAGKKAKVISSIAMFYDLDDPHAFVESIENCLHPEGVWVLELSYLPSMLRAVSYDTICHEHVTYYRLRTFERLLAETGLELFDVEFNDCNGGSFRLFVAPKNSREVSSRLSVARIEEANGLYDTRYPYEGFQTRVFRAKEAFQRFLSEAKTEGKKVYGYGASTKGQVTLQYCGVKPKQMVAIAERNPDKYGLYTPGTNIPICSESEMRAANPDYLVVLPWHFIGEFLQREEAYLRGGGQIVVPLPEFRIYSEADLPKVGYRSAVGARPPFFD